MEREGEDGEGVLQPNRLVSTGNTARCWGQIGKYLKRCQGWELVADIFGGSHTCLRRKIVDSH